MARGPQVERAERLRALHVPGRPFVLPCAWDAASAGLLATVPGVSALGTTSGGIAWSLGQADAGTVRLQDLLPVVERIASAVELPVSADVEAGYGDPAGTMRAVIEAGAVGVNLEDGTGDPAAPRRAQAAQCELLAAARAAADDAGVPVFINVRIDTWWAGGIPDEAARLEDAVTRAHAYVAAGADGVYTPAVTDPATIAALTAAIPAPLNLLAMPGLPGLAELATLGVARVSTGSGTFRAAVGAGAAAVAALLGAEQQPGPSYAAMQALFDPAG